MPMSGNGSGNIDQVHHLSAQNVPQGIGVIREHNLRHLNSRLTNGSSFDFGHFTSVYKRHLPPGHWAYARAATLASAMRESRFYPTLFGQVMGKNRCGRKLRAAPGWMHQTAS